MGLGLGVGVGVMGRVRVRAGVGVRLGVGVGPGVGVGVGTRVRAGVGGHALAALAAPDQVEGVVGVGHVEGVDQLELGVRDTALGGERGGAACPGRGATV